MNAPSIRRASLADIRRMKAAGELHTDEHAPEGLPASEKLDRDFWAAALEHPPIRLEQSDR